MIEIDNIIKTTLIKEHIFDSNKQTFTIVPNEELKIVITMPNNIFEWYINVFDRTDRKVHTNWLDHYGDNKVNLESEMKESVQGFINAVMKHPVRLSGDIKTGLSTLEVYRDNEWSDMIY